MRQLGSNFLRGVSNMPTFVQRDALMHKMIKSYCRSSVDWGVKPMILDTNN